MKRIDFITAMTVVAALAMGAIGYAMGPDGGGMSGSRSGGPGGHRPGMMDNSTHDSMMGSDQGFHSPANRQYQRPRFNQSQMQHSERLRAEIMEKRHEVDELLRSENPDREMIEQKMAELNRLEKELDYELSPN